MKFDVSRWKKRWNFCQSNFLRAELASFCRDSVMREIMDPIGQFVNTASARFWACPDCCNLFSYFILYWLWMLRIVWALCSVFGTWFGIRNAILTAWTYHLWLWCQFKLKPLCRLCQRPDKRDNVKWLSGTLSPRSPRVEMNKLNH